MLGFIFGIMFYGLIKSSQSLDNCNDANPNCIGDTIQEMNTRLNYLIYNRSCDHNAVFAKVYTTMTEYLALNLTDYTTNGALIYTNYFSNPQYMSIEDRLFANYYFNATDNWTSAQTNLVPQAWQIAFQAADNRELSALGDVMLGINAHINRDLPYVLARVGLTYPNGTSAKPDYNLVNNILFAATNDAINEIANQFDPNILKLVGPTNDNIVYKSITSMRNLAWNNALKLVNGTQTAAADIESDAKTMAEALRLLFQIDSTKRDAYCRNVFGLA